MFRRDLRGHFSFVAALLIGDHIPNARERRLRSSLDLLMAAGAEKPQPIADDAPAVCPLELMTNLLRRVRLRGEIRFVCPAGVRDVVAERA